ncbi:maternal effect protein oskar isoform X1 [Drosophila pseudoobscura]|uniref:Maternal effect protein oskar isoform X1 n=1 Tax=Drosophila pseudoobscura pseudoobscura TaxID=46245 RepID=A0A6I8URE4_DROPS|nr:maternal effect protein oskar isoform X1 [Drosophila pseudoobscura]
MATYRSAHSEPYTSKSNSNSNSSSSSRLTALRKRLTTCLQQWCQHLQKPASFQKCKSGPNHQFYKIFEEVFDSKVFGDKTKYIRQFKKIFKGNKDLAKKSEPGRVVLVLVPEKPVDDTEESQKKQLQLVARLFSSTLISAKEEISCSYNSSSMTIIDSNYIEVREEYPEIDSEIRSILLANAQSGITISTIKNEYRKLTGNPFPLHENITDFLLTIPHVTAECCVSGKRIFNMKPRPETRHLYDMVVHQKRTNDLGTNDHPVAAPPPRLWRCQYKRRALYSLNTNNNNNYNLNQNINHIEEKVPAVGGKEVTIEDQAGPLQQLARAAAESNWCYQDNWNHLKNCYQRANIFADPPEKPPPLPAQENHLRNSNSQNHRDNLKNQRNLLVNEHHSMQQEYQYQYPTTTPTPTTISSGTQHDSMFTINSDYDAYLLDFPLLGDDFLLYLARMELRCRFKRTERVLQSGLCVSGQTISGARSRLHHLLVNKGTQIIVNIGSVDIMRGRPIVQIQHDFRQLVKDMHNRGLVPILTTLAPLANYCHDKAMCDKVVKFNQFIWKECASYLKVIDIHSCLVNENGVVRFDCFQYSSRNVTGSKESYVFWNKIGRQRVLQMIEASLEY